MQGRSDDIMDFLVHSASNLSGRIFLAGQAAISGRVGHIDVAFLDVFFLTVALEWPEVSISKLPGWCPSFRHWGCPSAAWYHSQKMVWKVHLAEVPDITPVRGRKPLQPCKAHWRLKRRIFLAGQAAISGRVRHIDVAFLDVFFLTVALEWPEVSISKLPGWCPSFRHWGCPSAAWYHSQKMVWKVHLAEVPDITPVRGRKPLQPCKAHWRLKRRIFLAGQAAISGRVGHMDVAFLDVFFLTVALEWPEVSISKLPGWCPSFRYWGCPSAAWYHSQKMVWKVHLAEVPDITPVRGRKPLQPCKAHWRLKKPTLAPCQSSQWLWMNCLVCGNLPLLCHEAVWNCCNQQNMFALARSFSKKVLVQCYPIVDGFRDRWVLL